LTDPFPAPRPRPPVYVCSDDLALPSTLSRLSSIASTACPKHLPSPFVFFFHLWSRLPLSFGVVPLLWPTWLFTVVSTARQEPGSAWGVRWEWRRTDGAIGCRPSTQPPCVLRVDLQVGHPTSLGRDQPRVRERLDLVVRRTRREPRPQDPNEFVGLGRGEPAEPRRRVALFQQGDGCEIGRLNLVRAVEDQEDDVDVPFLAVLEELFHVIVPNPSIQGTTWRNNQTRSGVLRPPGKTHAPPSRRTSATS
jgi:hypothetical protein